MDAKGRTAVKMYGGRKYTFNGYYHTPYGQKVRGLVDLFAARNLHTGDIHHYFYDWKNSYIVTDYLQKLLDAHPDHKLIIIWDGWSAHRSNHTQAFIDLQPRLHILPLPTRASWLNPIERDFSNLQRFVLNNSDYTSVRDTMTAITNHITKELSPN